MVDSTKRTIRTLVQVLLGVCAAIAIAVPMIGATFPQAVAVGGLALSIAGLITKVVNTLEDVGILPGWLKDKGTTPQPPKVQGPVS